MAQNAITTISASLSGVLSTSGITRLASRFSFGPYGCLLSFVPDANCAGYLQLAQNFNPGGVVDEVNGPTASQLTPIAYTNVVTGVAEPVGTLVTFTASVPYAVIVGQPSHALYAIWTLTAGNLIVYASPYSTAPTATVNFSNVVIDQVPYNYDDNWELVPALVDAGGLTDAG